MRDGEDFLLETEEQDSWRVEKWRKLLKERTGSERTGGGKAKGVRVRQGDTREEAVGRETDPGTGSGSGEGVERVSATTFSMP